LQTNLPFLKVKQVNNYCFSNANLFPHSKTTLNNYYYSFSNVSYGLNEKIQQIVRRLALAEVTSLKYVDHGRSITF
jgi:hypothetical protein